jgi:hypothetical protein
MGRQAAQRAGIRVTVLHFTEPLPAVKCSWDCGLSHRQLAIAIYTISQRQ